ncbi:Signal transduction histidine kinase [Cohaesibacter sp. ES.047]|uniref:ATP-binding protein n=1 Tax=Cohaesibacter sp. ES.047 TaxID=1798205 RepID=UPI000BB903E2|nr:ATP-binding protein [Cohaesibacter sp. ES.047]SNY92814.1 Signal transduction histidine kinase [Cohaesibacter sp. ES.047]
MKSITRYLLVNVSIWAIVIAFGSGLVLTHFFRTYAEQSFDEQLDIVLKILVGELAAELATGEELQPPGNVGEPRYELPLSGWYWTVQREGSDEILLASPSLVGGVFTADGLADRDANGVGLNGYGTGPEGERLRVLERRISFADADPIILRITGNAEALEAQVSAFQTKAWLIMAAFGVILVSVMLVLIRTGLRPLHILRQQVRDVSEGQSDLIKGDYPNEVSGLVHEANLLIESNKDTLERARTQVGNLAHALKTPLSVIMNETRDLDDQKAKLVNQQSDIMRDQIQLYLERARMAARRNVIGTVTDPGPVIEKLVSVMQKIHPALNVNLRAESEKNMLFRGEEQDLEEMLGNLVDNACKWAQTSVCVSVVDGLPDGIEKTQTASEAQVTWLSILVDDDGQGMSETQTKIALVRGQRLDESKPGTGLGLSIVDELVELYGGRFQLSRAPLGGVRAVLSLPAIEKHDTR